MSHYHDVKKKKKVEYKKNFIQYTRKDISISQVDREVKGNGDFKKIFFLSTK